MADAKTWKYRIETWRECADDHGRIEIDQFDIDDVEGLLAERDRLREVLHEKYLTKAPEKP